ncbi:DUF421 domain-containing protein [Bacillus canaveralius]|uniref:DUF421 domain-containing protein n=1 Tax=Bacillus canaveralius TaxID=1403243 RepID=A0A2N5GKM8_9BACI|nr:MULTISPECIES: DUF421 domain-containing protein [Bacillus]PLR81451.1 DUF421 domain-containing protein [Bacillus sp. V33-4]PLR82062.1 DUF421 domain-containing protein [Bacillus canaveralius]PLR98032.1 DUF421 domain-containing protein [Bacillus canaveralius]RSK54388.1 DUF421 domain-containing protein [Bacillus canaveralius]
MQFFHIFIELVVGYIALFLITKLLGKTQITQITTFDFISALVLGELVGNAFYDEKIGLIEILFAIAIWGMLIFGTEILTQKKKGVRGLLEGNPSIVVRKGQIDYNQLRKNHLDINQLQHLLRKKDTFTIRECEYAILETDGSISVLKKPPFQTPTTQDLKLPLHEVHLPVTLILDGEIVYDNLQSIGWNEKDLEAEIEKAGVLSAKEVLYAEWLKGKPLHIQTYKSSP